MRLDSLIKQTVDRVEKSLRAQVKPTTLRGRQEWGVPSWFKHVWSSISIDADDGDLVNITLRVEGSKSRGGMIRGVWNDWGRGSGRNRGGEIKIDLPADWIWDASRVQHTLAHELTHALDSQDAVQRNVPESGGILEQDAASYANDPHEIRAITYTILRSIRAQKDLVSVWLRKGFPWAPGKIPDAHQITAALLDQDMDMARVGRFLTRLNRLKITREARSVVKDLIQARQAATRIAARWLKARTVTIPNPYNMTRDEFLQGTPEPKPRSGYQLLFHTTANKHSGNIAKHGLLTKHSISPPRGTIWASPRPDVFYASSKGALVIFQVPKRGSPADEDPRNAVAWDMGTSVVIARDIPPEDIVAIDPDIETDVGRNRLSFFRDSKYAEIYWDEWFKERQGQKSKVAARPIKLPEMELKELARTLANKLLWAPKPGEIITAVDVNVPHVKGHHVWAEVVLIGGGKPFSSNQDLIQGAYLKPRGGDPLIVIYINAYIPRKSFLALPQKIKEKELYRILTHELTHAADVLTNRGSASIGTQEEFKRKHHNHPAEVKALMRDVVTGVEDTVKEFMDGGMPFKLALQFALEDSKWADIKDYLTPKNKKTILKGVYTHLQDRGIV